MPLSGSTLQNYLIFYPLINLQRTTSRNLPSFRLLFGKPLSPHPSSDDVIYGSPLQIGKQTLEALNREILVYLLTKLVEAQREK